MAVPPVLKKPAQAEHKRKRFYYLWMRHFFSEDLSGAHVSSIEIQKRAVWIGLALILQSLNEISHDLYMPYLQAFSSLIPLGLLLGSFYALWMALRPIRSTEQAAAMHGTSQLWQRIILLLIILLTIPGCIEFGRSIMITFSAPEFSNDGTTLDTNAAFMLLQGHNPYATSNMPDMMQRFHIQPNWTTPLRVGPFAGSLDYPSMDQLTTAVHTSLRTHTMPEFETKVSYPALSFLTLLPFALLHDYNVFPFYILSYLLLVFIAWKVTPRPLRPWTLLLALANVPMWTSIVGGNLDIFYSLLLALAWLKRDQRWPCALFFGLALASKQIAWYFIPFYMLMIWQNYGLKEMFYRIGIAGCLGLAINLPFILWDPQAWRAGVMAPIADPMFPMGVGLVNLSVTHLLPYLPERLYSALEYGALLIALLGYWRICRKYPEAAMLLAILPLFLAWRSLPSYFYCVAFPLFILMLAKLNPQTPVSDSIEFSTVEAIIPQKEASGNTAKV